MTPTEQPAVGDYPPSQQEDTTEWIKMQHEVTKGETTATREAFEAVWQHKGWRIIEEGVDAPAMTTVPAPPASGDAGDGGKGKQQ